LRLYFHGPQGVGKRRCAEALAYEPGASPLVADLGRVVATETDFGETIKILFRENWFQDAILYLDGVDALRGNARRMAFDCVLDALAEDGGITIMAGATPWRDSNHRPVDVITVPFRLPDFATRRIEWQASLERPRRLGRRTHPGRPGRSLSPHPGPDRGGGIDRLRVCTMAGCLSTIRSSSLGEWRYFHPRHSVQGLYGIERHRGHPRIWIPVTPPVRVRVRL
jgi:hypothetical protein